MSKPFWWNCLDDPGFPVLPETLGTPPRKVRVSRYEFNKRFGLFMAALIIGSLNYIVAWYSLHEDIHAQRLRLYGINSSAHIYAKGQRPFSKSNLAGSDTSRDYFVKYRFIHGVTEYKGKAFIPFTKFQSLKIHDRIDITYLKNQPEISAFGHLQGLSSEDWDIGNAIIFFGTFILGSIFIAADVIFETRLRVIVKRAKLWEAVLAEVRSVENALELPGNFQEKEFFFKDRDNNTISKRIYASNLTDGEFITVLYNKSNPQQNQRLDLFIEVEFFIESSE